MPARPLAEYGDTLEETGDPMAREPMAGEPTAGEPTAGNPMAGDLMEDPGGPMGELRRELDEVRETLRTIRAGGIDALVIDTGDGEEVITLGGAERPLDELRRELEEARETLSTIRTGGFDALVIDTGRGEEVFALGGIERPYRLVEGLAEGARTYFRAVASDFDGTMAEGQIAADTLAAVDEARARGTRVILVTGRIMSELHAAFPDVEDHVDAVVAENGAVVITPVGVRQVAAPIGRAVSAALTARGVAHRSGQVLVAAAADDEPAALEVIRELGLDCQLVRNRGELMILPAGVTKGTGLLEALSDLGLSYHNTIGIGDAENDHSLLDACEIGVAVANSVVALRARADLVLALPDGSGFADLLRGPLLTGRAHAHPRRWQVTLGIDDTGQAVTLPASQLSIAVWGGTGDGKSYLAGLICEQLVRLRYSLIVIDPEGDYLGLGELRGVLVTGGDERRLADPAEVVRLLRHGEASVVIDLSHLDADARAAYAAGLSSEVEAHRAATGLPQWVVVDEAQRPIGRTATARRMLDPAAKGYLLVTWQPEELSADALVALDAVIALGSPHPASPLIDLTAAVADVPRTEIARLLTGPHGRAVLAWRQRPRRAVAFTLGSRITPHRRHEHKYDQYGVEPARRFHFRTEPDTPTGAIAANLAELEAELTRCDGGVLRHHCPGHDFSRWVSGVFHDKTLAADLGAAEAALPAEGPAAVVEQVRLALIAALQARNSS